MQIHSPRARLRDIIFYVWLISNIKLFHQFAFIQSWSFSSAQMWICCFRVRIKGSSRIMFDCASGLGVASTPHRRRYQTNIRVQIGDAQCYLRSSSNKDLFIRTLLCYGTLSGLVKCGHYNAEDRYPALFHRYQRFYINIIAESWIAALLLPTRGCSYPTRWAPFTRFNCMVNTGSEIGNSKSYQIPTHIFSNVNILATELIHDPHS